MRYLTTGDMRKALKDTGISPGKMTDAQVVHVYAQLYTPAIGVTRDAKNISPSERFSYQKYPTESDHRCLLHDRGRLIGEIRNEHDAGQIVDALNYILAGPDEADMDVQSIAEIAAALTIGKRALESQSAGGAMSLLENLLNMDTQHYLFLRTRDDTSSFFGCGTARGAVDVMNEDRKLCYLAPVAKAECPNCAVETDEAIDDNSGAA